MSDFENKYAEFVNSRRKEPEDITDFTAAQKDLLHMTLGVAGEAGELVDVVKKHLMYDQPLNLVNVVEELGDLEFYLQGLRNALHLNRQEIVRLNIAKLTARYPMGYSNEDAKERKDKK